MKNQYSYIGHEWQETSVIRAQLTEGRAKGVSAIFIENSSGLSLTVLEDRCLDIYTLRVKGKCIPYLSPCGIAAPAYFEPNGDEWLRNFSVGMLATCGFDQVGDPCSFNGQEYGLHGRASNLPAENVSVNTNDEEVVISAVIRQYKFQAQYLMLKRTINVKKFENKLSIHDEIINNGCKRQPFMMLYHFNFGYPLINPETHIVLPPAEVKGWDEYSESVKDKMLVFNPPENDYHEQTYNCRLKSQEKTASFSLANRKSDPEITAQITYTTENLPRLMYWKHLVSGEYVLAIEPCNNLARGVLDEDQNGTLQYLEPGETKTNSFELAFDVK